MIREPLSGMDEETFRAVIRVRNLVLAYIFGIEILRRSE